MSQGEKGQGGERRGGTIGLWQASAIGVGGMIGAGIFSVMGLAGRIAGPAAGIAFALAGGVALLCGWSFGRLGARYPSAGGPVEYLTRGIGDGVASGALNLLLWAGYVLAMAMYARAFGSYAASLMPEVWRAWAVPGLAILVTLAFLALNLAGAEAVGRLELLIVTVKVSILFGFVVLVAPAVETQRIAPSEWPGLAEIAVAGAIVFLSYEGFGLITNAAEDMRDPKRTLPRSVLFSVTFTIVVYVTVAFTVLGTLTVDALGEASEYALAKAAEPSLGSIGFVGMAIAALFSTASAINATLYGGANVSACLAEKGGLPPIFRKRVWMGSPGSLLITGGLVALIGAAVDVEQIAMAGSAAFLVVYGGVNYAHLRLLDETGARSLPVLVSLLACAAIFLVLLRHLYTSEPEAFVGLVSMLIGCWLVEWAWRSFWMREIEEREEDDPA